MSLKIKMEVRFPCRFKCESTLLVSFILRFQTICIRRCFRTRSWFGTWTSCFGHWCIWFCTYCNPPPPNPPTTTYTHPFNECFMKTVLVRLYIMQNTVFMLNASCKCSRGRWARYQSNKFTFSFFLSGKFSSQTGWSSRVSRAMSATTCVSTRTCLYYCLLTAPPLLHARTLKSTI